MKGSKFLRLAAGFLGFKSKVPLTGVLGTLGKSRLAGQYWESHVCFGHLDPSAF